MIYLDYNATAPIKPAVRVAVTEAMERYGNPSSVHRYGRIARRYVEDARASVAAFVGVKPAQVVFTGGGTEANNMVLVGIGEVPIITSTVEHDSVLACTPHAKRLPVNGDGVVDLAAAEHIFRSAPTQSLVSVMLANNETGVIQPVAELARLAKTFGHYMHTDGIQAAARLPIDFATLGVDFLTLSAHKIGGPQGVGALIISEHVVLQSLIKGGGQEMNRRAGTENGAGIIGFGVAVQLAADDLLSVPQTIKWRDQVQNQLLAVAGGDAVVIGLHAPRVANTLCIAMRNVKSETQIMAMDLSGVAVSSGAACSSGKMKVSHVLRAMGCTDDVARSALRISLGWNTEQADIDRCIAAWTTLYQRMHNKHQSEAA
jgi:cysteine desulfurase